MANGRAETRAGVLLRYRERTMGGIRCGVAGLSHHRFLEELPLGGRRPVRPETRATNPNRNNLGAVGQVTTAANISKTPSAVTIFQHRDPRLVINPIRFVLGSGQRIDQTEVPDGARELSGGAGCGGGRVHTRLALVQPAVVLQAVDAAAWSRP